MAPPLQDSSRYALSPYSAEFRDGATEAAFREHIHPLWVRDTRRAFLIAALFYLAFSITDFLILGVGEQYLIVFATRVLVAVSGLAIAFTAHHFWRALVDGITPSLVVALAMAGFLSITLLRPFESGWHGMSMMVMLLGTYVFIPNRFLPALVIALASTLVFIWVLVGHFELPYQEVLVMALLFLGMNLFGAMSAYRVSRLSRENFRDAEILRVANQRLLDEVQVRQRLEQDLIAQVQHDELTGVTNRRRFLELARQRMLDAEAGGQALSLLLLDVDYFKQINDTYGHLRADEVLRALARLCSTLLGEEALLARVGGEEFALLLEGDEAVARQRAERLRVGLWQTPIALSDASIHITVSIGVAQWRTGEPVPALMTRADRALQTAKYKGRNRVECAAELPG
ncbi:MAG: GGDEF domain-containing protein [Pseudomonadota bacterium]